MKAQFTGEVWLRKLARNGDWEVKDAFRFTDSRGNAVDVEAGFVTDGASIPRPLWWLYPPAGKYMDAAVVHDACYRRQAVSREDADRILYEAMRALGCRWSECVIFWVMLRGFGWVAWLRNKRKLNRG